MEHILHIEADIDKLDEVLDFVNLHLEAIDCPMKEQTRIDVATEEVYVNIANYAYGEGKGDMSLEVITEEDPKSIKMIFKDKGIPYNPLAKEDPDVSLPASERPIGGLGIFMVKKIADELSYEYKNGRNILTFYKAL